MKKLLSLLLMLALLLPVMACAEMTEEELHAWALANGYVKAEVDALSSATTNKAGGVNFGPIEWTEELQVMAIKEFLKGGHYLGDANYAQDASGWNYREMYQMATVYGGMPNNPNLELVLDIDSLCLLGVSEAGTSKTLHFNYNPNVSISWCRQLRPHEEETYNYYCSYGVQFDGVVRIFTPADLETEEGKAKLLNLFDKYYPTLATSWMGYAATFASLTDESEITAAKLAYIEKQLKGGAMVIYEVVPTRIIITAPFHDQRRQVRHPAGGREEVRLRPAADRGIPGRPGCLQGRLHRHPRRPGGGRGSLRRRHVPHAGRPVRCLRRSHQPADRAESPDRCGPEDPDHLGARAPGG